MRLLAALLILISLSACTLHPTKNMEVYLICRRIEDPEHLKLRCNKQKIIQFSVKVDM